MTSKVKQETKTKELDELDIYINISMNISMKCINICQSQLQLQLQGYDDL